MSDTQTDDTTKTDAVETDPNFSAERIEQNINGKNVSCMRVTFGPTRRTLVTRDLSLGDDFNLMALAGDLSDNQKWMLMARVAFSTITVDSLPIHSHTKKSQLNWTLDQIGIDGLRAYLRGAGELAEKEEDVQATAKN